MSSLVPERTFWEKAMLLHEETFRPADKPRKERMARHYYDLWCLITRGVADRAAADKALFARVAEHREIFFRLGWVDYTTLRPGSLRLTPPASHRDNWQQDYYRARHWRRRIVLHLPQYAPWASDWCRVARNLGAAPS